MLGTTYAIALYGGAIIRDVRPGPAGLSCIIGAVMLYSIRRKFDFNFWTGSDGSASGALAQADVDSHAEIAPFEWTSGASGLKAFAEAVLSAYLIAVRESG